MADTLPVTVIEADSYYFAGIGRYNEKASAILDGPNGGRFVVIGEGDAEYLVSGELKRGEVKTEDTDFQELEDDRWSLANDLQEAFARPNPNQPLPGMES